MSERTLSDADISAIVAAMQPHSDCVFSEDDKHDLRTVLQLYRDSTTAIRKGIIGLVLLGFLALAILGGAMQLRG